ncbi:MAG: LacI family DNA-binding transcriptional regulator [Oscillospiraceae bacterium]|nr:LacI family DNA-binding transcriptional regulator [Oscillospiraceae bacterium]
MKSNGSIKDIARKAGVSVATVSRVINKSGRYSQRRKSGSRG